MPLSAIIASEFLLYAAYRKSPDVKQTATFMSVFNIFFLLIGTYLYARRLREPAVVFEGSIALLILAAAIYAYVHLRNPSGFPELW